MGRVLICEQSQRGIRTKRPKSAHLYRCITPSPCRCPQIPPDAQKFGLSIRRLPSPATEAAHISSSLRCKCGEIKFACWAELIPATPSAGAVITNYRQASDGRLKPGILSGGVFYLRGEIPIRPTGQTGRYSSSIVMCPICRRFQSDINSLLSLPYLSIPVASLCGSYRRAAPWRVS